MRRARPLSPGRGVMRVRPFTLPGVALILALAAAGCTTGGSTQSAPPISTAYPSFDPQVSTCDDWFMLSPAQRDETLPWMYAELIKSEQDIPKAPYPQEKYILRLTKSDVSRGVAIIDARCKSPGDRSFVEVAFSDFPPSLSPGIYSPTASPAISHPSAKPSSSATSP